MAAFAIFDQVIEVELLLPLRSLVAGPAAFAVFFAASSSATISSISAPLSASCAVASGSALPVTVMNRSQAR